LKPTLLAKWKKKHKKSELENAKPNGIIVTRQNWNAKNGQAKKLKAHKEGSTTKRILEGN